MSLQRLHQQYMRNMSRLLKYVLGVALVSLSLSCSSEKKSEINVTISDIPSSEVVIKRLDLGSLTVIDTVLLDQTGRFSYLLDVKEGDPDIVYIFHNEKKLASLIVKYQDVIGVTADTSGNYSVTGSVESEKLAQVEKDYAEAFSKLTLLAQQNLQEEASQLYVDYYRSRIRYIMENSSSLSTIPVIYQTLGDNLPVLGQVTDAIHVKNVSEALLKSYPNSRYVRALASEAKRRMEYMQLQTQISTAEEIGFPEISLTDVNGQTRTLSEVDKKAVLVYFWTSTDAVQKMFNIETLLPIYKDFAPKGFEIYQVALDVDKSNWVRVAKAQNLPWISVCDIRGGASPYIGAYNLGQIPTAFLIYNGSIVDEKFSDGPSLRKVLRKLL